MIEQLRDNEGFIEYLFEDEYKIIKQGQLPSEDLFQDKINDDGQDLMDGVNPEEELDIFQSVDFK